MPTAAATGRAMSTNALAPPARGGRYQRAMSTERTRTAAAAAAANHLSCWRSMPRARRRRGASETAGAAQGPRERGRPAAKRRAGRRREGAEEEGQADGEQRIGRKPGDGERVVAAREVPVAIGRQRPARDR